MLCKKDAVIPRRLFFENNDGGSDVLGSSSRLGKSTKRKKMLQGEASFINKQGKLKSLDLDLKAM